MFCTYYYNIGSRLDCVDYKLYWFEPIFFVASMTVNNKYETRQ